GSAIRESQARLQVGVDCEALRRASGAVALRAPQPDDLQGRGEDGEAARRGVADTRVSGVGGNLMSSARASVFLYDPEESVICGLPSSVKAARSVAGYAMTERLAYLRST